MRLGLHQRNQILYAINGLIKNINPMRETIGLLSVITQEIT